MVTKVKHTKRYSEYLTYAKKNPLPKREVKAIDPTPAQPNIESTPEQENERVLIKHQGGIVEGMIIDRSSCGKYVKMTINGKNDGTWKELKRVDIISTFK
jgi:hypothetical protein